MDKAPTAFHAPPQQKRIAKVQTLPPQECAENLKARATSAVLVIVLMVLVYVCNIVTPDAVIAGKEHTSRKSTQPIVKQVPLSSLPAPVNDMRDAILNAIELGDINEMRVAIEWNELRPDLGFDNSEDPIRHWKTISTDGDGHEILAILANLLRDAPAQVPLGQDFENNAVFVWPYVAELPLKALSPAQTVKLYQIVPSAVAKSITQSGKWSWYRIAIGADGTWHTFSKPE